MIAYSIGLMVGETVRDYIYGSPDRAEDPQYKLPRKWFAYSGLFVLIKQKLKLTYHEFDRLVRQVLLAFKQLVLAHVRT